MIIAFTEANSKMINLMDKGLSQSTTPSIKLIKQKEVNSSKAVYLDMEVFNSQMVMSIMDNLRMGSEVVKVLCSIRTWRALQEEALFNQRYTKECGKGTRDKVTDKWDGVMDLNFQANGRMIKDIMELCIWLMEVFTLGIGKTEDRMERVS